MIIIAACSFLFLEESASGLPKFTDEQIMILESGDLLKVPVNKAKSSGYRGGKSYILVKADKSTCFRIMADIKNYYFFYDDTLIEANLPEGTVVAHKHGFGDGGPHADAGIVFTPGGDYVLVVYLYAPRYLEWAEGQPLIADISLAAYNYFNPAE